MRLLTWGGEAGSLADEAAASTACVAVQNTTSRSFYALEAANLLSGQRAYASLDFVTEAADGPFYVRVYFRAAEWPSVTNRWFALSSASTPTSPVVWFTISAAGALQLVTAGGTVGSPTTLALNQWYRLECLFERIAGMASGTIRARLDGTEFAASTSQNFATGIRYLCLGGNMNAEANVTGRWFMDDVAVNDDTGTTQNSYPGVGAIVRLVPNAAGSVSEWTGSYGSIDNIPPDSTYIESATTEFPAAQGQPAMECTAAYALTNAPASINVADAITLVSLWVKRSGTTGGSDFSKDVFLASIAATAGGTRLLTDELVKGPSAVSAMALLTAYVRPDTLAAWTKAVLDTIEVGVVHRADRNWPAPPSPIGTLAATVAPYATTAYLTAEVLTPGTWVYLDDGGVDENWYVGSAVTPSEQTQLAVAITSTGATQIWVKDAVLTNGQTVHLRGIYGIGETLVIGNSVSPTLLTALAAAITAGATQLWVTGATLSQGATVYLFVGSTMETVVIGAAITPVAVTTLASAISSSIASFYTAAALNTGTYYLRSGNTIEQIYVLGAIPATPVTTLIGGCDNSSTPTYVTTVTGSTPILWFPQSWTLGTYYLRSGATIEVLALTETWDTEVGTLTEAIPTTGAAFLYATVSVTGTVYVQSGTTKEAMVLAAPTVGGTEQAATGATLTVDAASGDVSLVFTLATLTAGYYGLDGELILLTGYTGYGSSGAAATTLSGASANTSDPTFTTGLDSGSQTVIYTPVALTVGAYYHFRTGQTLECFLCWMEFSRDVTTLYYNIYLSSVFAYLTDDVTGDTYLESGGQTEAVTLTTPAMDGAPQTALADLGASVTMGETSFLFNTPSIATGRYYGLDTECIRIVSYDGAYAPPVYTTLTGGSPAASSQPTYNTSIDTDDPIIWVPVYLANGTYYLRSGSTIEVITVTGQFSTYWSDLAEPLSADATVMYLDYAQSLTGQCYLRRANDPATDDEVVVAAIAFMGNPGTWVTGLYAAMDSSTPWLYTNSGLSVGFYYYIDNELIQVTQDWSPQSGYNKYYVVRNCDGLNQTAHTLSSNGVYVGWPASRNGQPIVITSGARSRTYAIDDELFTGNDPSVSGLADAWYGFTVTRNADGQGAASWSAGASIYQGGRPTDYWSYTVERNADSRGVQTHGNGANLVYGWPTNRSGYGKEITRGRLGTTPLGFNAGTAVCTGDPPPTAYGYVLIRNADGLGITAWAQGTSIYPGARPGHAYTVQRDRDAFGATAHYIGASLVYGWPVNRSGLGHVATRNSDSQGASTFALGAKVCTGAKPPSDYGYLVTRNADGQGASGWTQGATLYEGSRPASDYHYTIWRNYDGAGAASFSQGASVFDGTRPPSDYGWNVTRGVPAYAWDASTPVAQGAAPTGIGWNVTRNADGGGAHTWPVDSPIDSGAAPPGYGYQITRYTALLTWNTGASVYEGLVPSPVLPPTMQVSALHLDVEYVPSVQTLTQAQAIEVTWEKPTPTLVARTTFAPNTVAVAWTFPTPTFNVVGDSSFVFNVGAEGVQNGTIAWTADTIKARLLAPDATPTRDDTAMTGHTAIGTDTTLGTKTVTKDVASDRIVYDCADPEWTAVPNGNTVGWVVFYKDGADDASRVPIYALEVPPVTATGVNMRLLIAATGLFFSQQ